MEEVSKHLEDKDNESSHLWGHRGKCGHGFTPDLGSGGVDSGDEQEGGHHHPAPCPPHAPRWASSWVFAVIHVGPLEGFKLMIVLIRFAFEKELPGTGLGS